MMLRPLRTTALLLVAVLLVVAVPNARPVVAQSPAQTITIESPPPGTQVGSPMVVTGRVARLPANASLNYRFFAGDGRVIGSGSFPIPGNPGEPAYFLASLSFEEPLDGDAVNLQLAEADPATGALIGVVTLPVTVAPRPQQILIETPPTGTQVGSPVVLTGRAARYPATGALQYRIVDGQGTLLGSGTVPVSAAAGGQARFAASLAFAPPAANGPLRAEIYDVDERGVFTVAATSLRWGP